MDMDAKKNKVDILSLCAEFIIEKVSTACLRVKYSFYLLYDDSNHMAMVHMNVRRNLKSIDQ